VSYFRRSLVLGAQLSNKLSHWASIAEILSGLAVVITLLLLVVGIRENTEITRASVYGSSIDSMNDFRTRIVDDRDVARLWSAYQLGELDDLDQPDQARLAQLIIMLFGIYEKAYYAREYDVIGLSEWSRFEFQICRQYDRVRASSFLNRNLEVGMTEQFLTYISMSCAQGQE